MDINEINVELSENFQRYVNECCESESDGKIDGFAAGYCKRRGGGVAVAVWCVVESTNTLSQRSRDMLLASAATTTSIWVVTITLATCYAMMK
jgi:hypothetical protein